MKTESRSKQTTIVRGICSVLQKMAMPTLQNLDDELKKFGYKVVTINNEPVSEQTEKNYQS